MSDSVLKRFSSLKISCRSKWRRLSCFSKSFTVPNVQVFVWMCSCEDPCHTPASFIDHPRINDYMSAESIQKSWMEEPLSDLPMSDSLSFSASLSSHHSPHKLDRKHWFLMLKSLPHTHTTLTYSIHTHTHVLPIIITGLTHCSVWPRLATVATSARQPLWMCLCTHMHMCMFSRAPTCCQFTQPKSTRGRQRQRKRGSVPLTGSWGSCGRTAVLSHSYSFILPLPRPLQLPPLRQQHPQQQPPTHPPPRASLCAQREALLSSHACLLFPPGPPLVLFGEQLTAGCVWDPAEQTHTRSEQDTRGRRTHLTPPWCPPRSLLEEWFLVSGACVCGGQVYLVFWWKYLFVLYVISWMVSICQLHQCNIIMSQIFFLFYLVLCKIL